MFLDKDTAEIFDEMRAHERAKRLAAQESKGSRLHRIYRQIGQIISSYPNNNKTYETATNDNNKITENLAEIDRVNGLRSQNEHNIGYSPEMAKEIELEFGAKVLRLENEINLIKTTRTTADDLKRESSKVE